MSTEQPHWQPPGGERPPAPGSQYPAYGATPPSPPPAWVEHRPGVIPLRPLTMSDVFGGVVATIRGNLAATLGLGLLVTAAVVIPLSALGAWWAGQGGVSLDGLGADEVASVNAVLGTVPASLGQALTVLVLAAFVSWVVGQAALGRRVAPGQVWEATRGRLVSVFLTVLLLGVVVLVAMGVLVGVPLALLALAVGSTDRAGGGTVVLLVLAGLGVFVLAVAGLLVLWTRFAFATSAVVLEEAGPWTALRRSWALTRGSQFWRVLGIRLLTVLAVYVVTTAVTTPASFLLDGALGALGSDASAAVGAQVWAAALGTVVAGVLTTPFSSGVDALLYIDQRMRREGLDVTLLRATQATDGTQAR